MDFTKYVNKMEYPKRALKPRLKDEYRRNVSEVEKYAKELKQYEESLPAYSAARALYDAESLRLEELFYTDAIEEVGLTGHPKARQVFNYAWDLGHAYGYSEVVTHLSELAELVK